MVIPCFTFLTSRFLFSTYNGTPVLTTTKAQGSESPHPHQHQFSVVVLNNSQPRGRELACHDGVGLLPLGISDAEPAVGLLAKGMSLLLPPSCIHDPAGNVLVQTLAHPIVFQRQPLAAHGPLDVHV